MTRSVRRPLPARLRRRESTCEKREGQPKRLFQALDHIVGNVELGHMDEWVDLLQQGHGLREHGGVHRRRHRHRLLRADVQGRRQRQPPGEVPAQRAGDREEEVARSTSTSSSTAAPAPSTSPSRPNDILPTVDALRANGVEFLDTPDSYYEDAELRARIGKVRVPIEELQKRRILVDRDEDGYLLQIFTKPLGDRPTVFFELIERHGYIPPTPEEIAAFRKDTSPDAYEKLGGPADGLAALRRAADHALAGRRPLRRYLRLPWRQRLSRLALPRLRAACLPR